MIKSMKWFDRKFTGRPPVGTFPVIVERLRGTPARIEEKTKGLSKEQLTKRLDDAWSIQENIGHLLDVEALWTGRLDDLLAGEKELRPADLTNTATHQANHNARSLEELTVAFRRERLTFVERLDRLTEAQASLEASHPRLKQPMRTIDLCHFVAEHDDQHLARMTEILKTLEG
jgi:uncharacterized damage-inducible protein DinB